MRSHSLFTPCAIFLHFTVCLAASYQKCRNPSFNCAGVSMSYPFGIMDQGCGLLGFQVECDGNPHLHVHHNNYRILNTSMIPHRRIIMANEKLFEPCGLDPDVYDNLHNSFFLVSRQNFNITELRDCGKIKPKSFFNLRCNGTGDDYSGWYLGFGEEAEKASCSEAYKVPVLQKPKTVPKNSSQFIQLLQKGFQVEWLDHKIIFPDCGGCESTKGVCGYLPDNENFCCYCPNGLTHPHNCSDGHHPGAGSQYSHQTKKSLSGAAIGIMGIVGSALFIVVVMLVIAYRKRSSFFKRQLLGIEHNNARPISQVEIFLQNYVHEMPARFSYSQLKNITDSFAHKLGEGGFGVVYKGILEGGNLVAVKILDQSRQSETQFMNEVATIGRIHHRNLVRLMGYCFEGFTSALLYEYMANGSLEKFILADKETVKFLCWEQIHLIALGAARGIAYLHNECHGRIIHFDIKPHNILLDEDFTAKVGDFGLAKLCGRQDDHVSMTATRGTPGYAAPEVWSRNMGPVTDKSDVYGFGMMLLEMVGGRKNIDLQASRSSQNYFPEWAFKLIGTGELGARLTYKDGSELVALEKEKAIKLAKVGLWCIQYNSTNRPSMNRVVQMLEGNADDVIDPPLPFNAVPRGPLLGDTEESLSS